MCFSSSVCRHSLQGEKLGWSPLWQEEWCRWQLREILCCSLIRRWEFCWLAPVHSRQCNRLYERNPMKNIPCISQDNLTYFPVHFPVHFQHQSTKRMQKTGPYITVEMMALHVVAGSSVMEEFTAVTRKKGIFMDFDKIWWILMDFDGFWWILMGFDKIWWGLMGFDGFWWGLAHSKTRICDYLMMNQRKVVSKYKVNHLWLENRLEI